MDAKFGHCHIVINGFEQIIICNLAREHRLMDVLTTPANQVLQYGCIRGFVGTLLSISMFILPTNVQYLFHCELAFGSIITCDHCVQDIL